MDGPRAGNIRGRSVAQTTARQSVGIELSRVFEDKVSGKRLPARPSL